ncbi:EAL domain-containing protein [Sporomusa ovata]|nr:EAL domain-containing protein [Sporomusa ovata]
MLPLRPEVIVRLAELSVKIAEQRHVTAIRQGLLINIPLVVIGSFANMFINLPLPVYQQFMINMLGSQWKTIGSAIYNSTFGMLSVLLVLSISYFLAESSVLAQNGSIYPKLTSIVSLTCLIAIIQPFSSQGTLGLPLNWLGMFGLMPAILTALTATEIFLYLSSIKKIRLCLFFDEADPVISQAVAGIFPAAITLLIFSLVKFVTIIGAVMDIHQLVYDLIKYPFVELPNTLGTAIIFHIMVQLLWFFGIHGQTVLGAIQQNIYASATDKSLTMYLEGGQPTEFLTTSFINAYSTIGGSGSTICLIIAILFLVRKGNTARLAKLSILPGIFNINELLVFGLPIVLNPIYFIPFLLAPIIMTSLSYTAIAVGFVPMTNSVFNWTTPILLSGYMATNSWTGVVLQLINIMVGVAIYLPFVWLANKEKALKMNHALDTLFKLAISNSVTQYVLTRRDTVGNLSRVLAHDLREALAKQELTLEYQPQIDQNEQVTGVEALLRWHHKVFGPIPPPLIIVIAEESGMIHSLGKWVIDTACCQLKNWNDKEIDITMSVNVSATQFDHGNILEDISRAIDRNGIQPKNFEIEITESIAMNTDTQTKKMLNSLYQMGVRIAIDDFGMGHSSLSYIKNFPVNTLKIDKSLSMDIAKEKSCKEIVSSIISLCASLNIKTIVEYVETEEQRTVLRQLGCVHCQGYLYSPAISPDKAYEYISKMNEVLTKTSHKNFSPEKFL